jgi:hypothetical protein
MAPARALAPLEIVVSVGRDLTPPFLRALRLCARNFPTLVRGEVGQRVGDPHGFSAGRDATALRQAGRLPLQPDALRQLSSWQSAEHDTVAGHRSATGGLESPRNGRQECLRYGRRRVPGGLTRHSQRSGGLNGFSAGRDATALRQAERLPLVRLRGRVDRTVGVRFCAVKSRAVSNRNCVAAMRGGEQRGENDQSITSLDELRQVNSIRSARLGEPVSERRSL